MHGGHAYLGTGSLAHLSETELAAEWELASLARLAEADIRWHGIVLPATFEARFYSLNNLPAKLSPLFRGLDPLDPDEDVLEEAEEEAVPLIAQHYLLDEWVDLVYDSLSWTGQTVVRRPGAAGGREASNRRGALLAVKALFQDDWRVDAVSSRLATTGAYGIEARPVLLTPGSERPAADLSRRASAALGAAVKAWSDANGRLTRLRPA
ncbi:MAG: hypothetical protein KF875_04955 [Trueperaceae bacterium]|nr:hypothetical protein [Trueperaceae bacterium]MCC6310735.1 hypothetical protein [Trueperaceae bacterium]MCO5174116.1 hypothetical protein [Trueperaceae bacterium]MCW5820019.1 hypothetical protein [Trueperaceae bacterium]